MNSFEMFLIKNCHSVYSSTEVNLIKILQEKISVCLIIFLEILSILLQKQLWCIDLCWKEFKNKFHCVGQKIMRKSKYLFLFLLIIDRIKKINMY